MANASLLHSNTQSKAALYLAVTTTNRENNFNIVVPWNLSTFKDIQYNIKKIYFLPPRVAFIYTKGCT